MSRFRRNVLHNSIQIHKIMLAVSVTDNTHTTHTVRQEKKNQTTPNMNAMRASGDDTLDNSLDKEKTSEDEDAFVRSMNANKFANFLLQRLYRYDNYTFDESIALVSNIMRLRNICKKQRRAKYIQLVITGFAKQPMRNLFFRALKYALRADIHYGAYVESNTSSQCLQRFEVFVTTHVKENSNLFLDPENIMQYLECFKLGLTCVDVSNASYTATERPNPCVLTAIDRIQKGTWHYGNWFSSKNTFHRERIQSMQEARDLAQRQENVRDVTGMTLTPGNMLSLYFNHRNMMQQVRDVQAGVYGVRTRLRVLIPELRRATAIPNNSVTQNQLFNSIDAELHSIISDAVWSELYQLNSPQRRERSQPTSPTYSTSPPPPPPPPRESIDQEPISQNAENNTQTSHNSWRYVPISSVNTSNQLSSGLDSGWPQLPPQQNTTRHAWVHFTTLS